MATKLKAWTQSATNALTTELNSLANGTASGVSGAISNSANLDLVMDVELLVATQASARSAGATVALYLSRSLDDTNHADAVIGTDNPVFVFPLDAATTSRREVVSGIELIPGSVKLWVVNSTGQAFAASGNTVRYRTRSIETA